MAKLSECADLTLLFENKQIHSICSNELKNSGVQFEDLNDVITKKLAAVFGPVAGHSYSARDIVTFASNHPGYKFASVKSVPYVATSVSEFETSYKWRVYVEQLRQTLRVPLMNGDLVDAETRSASLAKRCR